MRFVHECGQFCRDGVHNFGFLVPLDPGDPPPEVAATQARERFEAYRLADGAPVEIVSATATDLPPVADLPAVRSVSIYYRQLPAAARALRS